MYQKNQKAVWFYQREGFAKESESVDEDTEEQEYVMYIEWFFLIAFPDIKIKNTRLISESRISIYTKYFIVHKHKLTLI